MRKIWVRIDPWKKSMATAAIEGGADGLLLPEGYSEKAKALGKIKTIAADGDLKPGQDVVFFTIKSGADEEQIVKLSHNKKVILECSDWTIIPLENLIARGADVIARVDSLEEARTAFGILEKGVRHILFCPQDSVTLKHALLDLRSAEIRTDLETAEIISVKPLGMGDRVCIDTCTSMAPGQGTLVGNSSGGLFLIHSESISNPYVSPRPFRVNAGPVHAYTRVPGGKTRYLSELVSGDPVLLVDYQGNTNTAVVGRLKIEKRPLMLVTAAVAEKQISTIVQNAETVRLTAPDGQALSVVTLSTGDPVLVAVESYARHFGMKIDENITEK